MNKINFKPLGIVITLFAIIGISGCNGEKASVKAAKMPPGFYYRQGSDNDNNEALDLKRAIPPANYPTKKITMVNQVPPAIHTTNGTLNIVGDGKPLPEPVTNTTDKVIPIIYAPCDPSKPFENEDPDTLAYYVRRGNQKGYINIYPAKPLPASTGGVDQNVLFGCCIAHEMGHALGVSTHSTDNTSIMQSRIIFIDRAIVRERKAGTLEFLPVYP